MPSATGNTPIGASPINVNAPRLGIRYIIALVGIFPSRSSADPLIGEIFLFAGNFAPRGFALCEGQLLPIASHSALFSILGTMYGGDGRTTFALPDLRGRSPVGTGTGAGLAAVSQGERYGSETVSLPNHGHGIPEISPVPAP